MAKRTAATDKTVTVTLSQEQDERLRAEAERLGVGRSTIVRWAIETYINQQHSTPWDPRGAA